jgi:molybdate transport system permease protein
MEELQVLSVSVRVALFATVFLLIACPPLVFWRLSIRSRWMIVPESLVMLPMVLPPSVVGFYMLIAFSPATGFGAWLDAVAGIRLLFSMPVIVIGSVVLCLPLMYQSLKSGMQALDPALLEASYSLGKNRAQTFFRVVLPGIGPSLFSGAILVFCRALGEFGLTLMIGGSIPGKTKTLSIALFERVESYDYAGANRYALIILAFSWLCIGILQLSSKAKTARLP